MIRLYWQDQILDVSRIVLRSNDRSAYEETLVDLAHRLRIDVGRDDTTPTPGDFWVGCHPRAGWGDADPSRIGWASLVEVPLAVGLFHLKAAERARAVPVVLDEPYSASDREFVVLAQ